MLDGLEPLLLGEPYIGGCHVVLEINKPLPIGADIEERERIGPVVPLLWERRHCCAVARGEGRRGTGALALCHDARNVEGSRHGSHRGPGFPRIAGQKCR